jgi:hypothetical protein
MSGILKYIITASLSMNRGMYEYIKYFCCVLCGLTLIERRLVGSHTALSEFWIFDLHILVAMLSLFVCICTAPRCFIARALKCTMPASAS